MIVLFFLATNVLLLAAISNFTTPKVMLKIVELGPLIHIPLYY